MLESQYTRFDPTIHQLDQQCPITHFNQQCPYIKEKGLGFCPRHIGRGRTAEENKRVKNYRLTKHKARVEEFADSQGAKSLREEIGILRLVLEETINKCHEPIDLIVHTQSISNLAVHIEKLVTSCHKLEQSTKFLIDKPALIRLAAQIIVILEDRVDDPALVDLISQDMMRAILETGHESEDSAT